MRRNDCAAVEFKRVGGAYRGSVSLRDLSKLRGDPAETLRAVAGVYQKSMNDIKQWQREAQTLRDAKSPLPARKAWQLGDILHRLQTELMARGCKVQSVYDHLERHAGLHPKRAAEFAAFRRHLDDAAMIPRAMTWNRIVKSVKPSAAAMSRQARGRR